MSNQTKTLQDELDEIELAEIDTVTVRRDPSAKRPAIDFDDYAAGDRWPLDVLDTFVEILNPSDREVRAEIWLGPDARLHVALERMRPRKKQLSDASMRELLEARRPIRPAFMRCNLVIPPGATRRVPKSWLNALRTVQSGHVVGGLAPMIQVVGEEPLPLAEALREFQPPAPTRRRAL